MTDDLLVRCRHCGHPTLAPVTCPRCGGPIPEEKIPAIALQNQSGCAVILGIVLIVAALAWMKDSIVGWFSLADVAETATKSAPATTSAPTPGVVSRYVSAASLPGTWPLTVSSGNVECYPGNLITFNHGGTRYALNGLAEGHASQRGWRSLETIWATDPALGAKLSVGALIDAGEKACVDLP